jgi:hypothetical protein
LTGILLPITALGARDDSDKGGWTSWCGFHPTGARRCLRLDAIGCGTPAFIGDGGIESRHVDEARRLRAEHEGINVVIGLP